LYTIYQGPGRERCRLFELRNGWHGAVSSCITSMTGVLPIRLELRARAAVKGK
jgi:hypothetical protein